MVGPKICWTTCDDDVSADPVAQGSVVTETSIARPAAAAAVSVLYRDAAMAAPLRDEPPAFFRDLNLDQVVTALTADREEYHLAPLFFTRLTSVADVTYRQQVARDLASPAMRQAVAEFAEAMRVVRRRISFSQRLPHRYRKDAWLLEAAARYLAAVNAIDAALSVASPQSEGLRGFATHLASYRRSAEYDRLALDAAQVREQLAALRYCLHLEPGRLRVERYDGQADYAEKVSELFARFRRDPATDYRQPESRLHDLTHLEEWAVDRVARLHPAAFDALAEFGERHSAFLDPMVTRFDREAQFYLAYWDHIERMQAAGLSFCYPEITEDFAGLHVDAFFDLALTDKLVRQDHPVVCNDVHLERSERVIVVTGPNQGGKTTFARAIGQIHHLAALGLPVPGRVARLPMCDEVFTHFERGENLSNLRGKLEDDLIRVHSILGRAGPRSLIVLNEIFNSTTLDDAVLLGRRVIEHVLRLGSVAVCVTFLDELATISDQVVSMVAEVNPADPATRTFRLSRRPADGLAYTRVLAHSHALTYDTVVARLSR
ncbi:MAG TPA: DNA mismatch repair protein MutS [Mycobacteriales bacterium]|nr:DNA mismatch repair protein MutS [Mycobacteriales bacterium]